MVVGVCGVCGGWGMGWEVEEVVAMQVKKEAKLAVV